MPIDPESEWVECYGDWTEWLQGQWSTRCFKLHERVPLKSGLVHDPWLLWYSTDYWKRVLKSLYWQQLNRKTQIEKIDAKFKTKPSDTKGYRIGRKILNNSRLWQLNSLSRFFSTAQISHENLYDNSAILPSSFTHQNTWERSDDESTDFIALSPNLSNWIYISLGGNFITLPESNIWSIRRNWFKI